MKTILQAVTDGFEETPFEINNGCCEDWALEAQSALKVTEHKVAIWETVFGLADTIHVFLQIDGKFFDAECLDGVENYMQLPIFAKLDRPQPVIFMDGNFEPAINRYHVNCEQLIECGYTPSTSK